MEKSILSKERFIEELYCRCIHISISPSTSVFIVWFHDDEFSFGVSLFDGDCRTVLSCPDKHITGIDNAYNLYRKLMRL